MPAATPIVLDLFDVFENPRVELTVEGMVWLLLARTRFEEIRTPPSPLTQPPPKGICSDFSLNEFLPEHPISYDPAPFFTDQFCIA